MATKQYPVRVYFFYDEKGNRRWYKDKHNAWMHANDHMTAHRASEITVRFIEFPRMLNAEVALAMLTGIGLHKFQEGIHEKLFNYDGKKKEHEEKANTKPKPNSYTILGLDPGAYFTKDDLNEAFKKAAMQHHPDRGGSNEAMQAVNDARVSIRRAMGWM